MGLGAGKANGIHEGTGPGVPPVDRMPTPIARSMVRVQRSEQAGAAEQYLALGYLSEVFLKYMVLTLHACIKSLDTDAWTYWGYRLSRGEGLGEWEQALTHLDASARLGGAGGWLRDNLDWLSTRRTGRREVGWYSRCHELSESLWQLARGPLTDYQRSVRGLLSFVVSLRNRTRGHGALPPDFYPQAVPMLRELLELLIGNATPLEGGLLWCEGRGVDVIARVLSGPTPAGVEARKSDSTLGLVLEDPDRTWATGFSPLLLYRASDDACFFANGKWNSTNATVEGLDYFSGDCIELPLEEFRTPPAPKPRSQTAGGSQLVAEVRTSHNLPVLGEGYVDRLAPEQTLQELLGDRQHRIITLHGMGGTGKTSLALRVSSRIVRQPDCSFDLVLWFSARDVDLLVEGPQPREREIHDIEGIAETYCRMLNGTESGREALEILASEIGDPSNRLLLIMDNFETLDDPTAVHEYLDATVVLPNKVLITSRHRAFKGDYPLEVSGMELEEAAQLLAAESRRVGCEPKMTTDVVRRVHDYAGGVPYAMKLVVGQIARNIPLNQVLDEALTENRILDALFLRSFQALSDGGKRLFLLVGNLRGDVDALLVRAVFAQSGLHFDSAVDELERVSLVEVVEESGRNSLRMPQVTKNFAERELPVARGGLDIERDLALLREVYGARGTDSDPLAFARRISGQIRASREAEKRAELTKLLEALADQEPRTWRVVAETRGQLDDPPSSVREAYEMAVRYEPNESDLWQEWARFEADQGNRRREVELLIRGAESAPDNIGLNSNAAYRVANLISTHLEEFPVADRAVWTGILKRNLEEHFEELDPGPLARLGWLYYLENDRRNAERCARRGVQLEPGHEHCTNILKRLGIVPDGGRSGA
jgi:tetratricopeptide (TPR) repeat protein